MSDKQSKSRKTRASQYFRHWFFEVEIIEHLKKYRSELQSRLKELEQKRLNCFLSKSQQEPLQENIAQESERPIITDNNALVPHYEKSAQDAFNKQHPMCFEYDGEFEPSDFKNRCMYTEQSFKKGNIFMGIFSYLSSLVGTALVLFLFRRWVIWLFKHKKV